jgi:adenylosuccinate lyase
MELGSLTAISPIDGRYRSKTHSLDIYFSEFGLMRYRVLVEIEYFIALTEIPLGNLGNIKNDEIASLRNIYQDFKITDAQEIKKIEATTNHDVKAVEYFLRQCFNALGLDHYKEFIHFGLTSQDINNTAIPVSLKEGITNCLYPDIEAIIFQLDTFSEQWKDIPMLARTHGQPASPTKLGKEFRVFAERLRKQYAMLNNITYYGKFGGATGNFNAHHVAYPNMNWGTFANEFLQSKLGLERNEFTTQIDHYDDLAVVFDNISRINVILKDLCQDIWLYISAEYFRQKTIENEVGSSAMPHKVNPIDFENAEGNLGIANSIFHHFSAKLPVSRLQRDLTDSTVLRNIGVPLAHSLISYQSILKGFGKLIVNEEKIKKDLEDNWAVVAEAIQTVLRRENYPDPYNVLKVFSRGKEKLTSEDFREFILSLNIEENLLTELLALTPFNYTGI